MSEAVIPEPETSSLPALQPGKCRGDGIPELIQLSGTFLEQAIKDSAEENVPYPDGTNYEKYLYMLIKK